ncbi:MAG TPA: hypothetical protein VHD63_09670 [Ktedonobacteraceae bacterium]|nr:hypothetical protein [Ktedonobacteraceae bacterium]
MNEQKEHKLIEQADSFELDEKALLKVVGGNGAYEKAYDHHEHGRGHRHDCDHDRHRHGHFHHHG